MILFFGPPGSGKSVQGELLIKRNNWQWLSTGQLFRDSKDPEIHKRLASGELIDDELTNKVLATALSEVDDDVRVVLDGYPRNTDQAAWLFEYLSESQRNIMCVLQFDVPKEEIMRRLGDRGRVEDSEEVIERRLEIYHEKTKPVLDYYRDKDVVMVKVDGTGAVEEVHERIYKAIEACTPK